MKNLKTLVAAIALACVAIIPASAQFRVGVRAGMAVNKLHFSEKTFSSDNRTGFTGGVTAEFTVPVVGIGFDASVLYARKSAEILEGTQKVTDNRDYLDIPVNLKYKFGLPVIGKIITPFLTTGPDFSVLLTGKNIGNAFHNRKFDTAWTFGAGLQLVSHLQIAANYGIGLSKSVSGSQAQYASKNRCWTVTASYYF